MACFNFPEILELPTLKELNTPIISTYELVTYSKSTAFYPDCSLLSQIATSTYHPVNQSLEIDMATAFDLVSSHIAIARAGHNHREAIGKLHRLLGLK